MGCEQRTTTGCVKIVDPQIEMPGFHVKSVSALTNILYIYMGIDVYVYCVCIYIYIYMHSYLLIPLHGPPFHLRAYIYVYRENKYTYAHICDHVRRAGLGSWVACFTGSPCCPATRVRPKALGARRDGRLASPRCKSRRVRPLWALLHCGCHAVDGQSPAPPEKAWNDPISRVNTNK